MDRLPIYLNDHLTGATAGAELARRTAGANDGSEYGEPLGRLAEEIEEDRATLKDVMSRLDIGEDKLKVVAGWMGEKFGRLKLNGQLLGYSPLSRLIELEGLLIGSTARAAMWRSLELLGEERLEGIDFAALRTRAETQRDELAGLRDRAAAEALP